MTSEDLLKRIFPDAEVQKEEGQYRLTRVRVPGRELSLAHQVGVTTKEVYQNLGLHIGVHEGENHEGESLGFLKFTPWEATVVAADIAIKSGNVGIGFLDRFCGSLILTGAQDEVQSSIEGVVAFFRDELHFPVCEITRS